MSEAVTRKFTVLVNEEDQYSIWPESLAVPAGWTPTGTCGTMDTCVAFVEAVWTDMRPRSLRHALNAVPLPV